MTIEELKTAIAEKEAKSAELRTQIQANTDAARKLNDDNRTLMKERKDVEHDKRELEHDLKKAEQAE